jgi:sugar lactone lactonase YvrE
MRTKVGKILNVFLCLLIVTTVLAVCVPGNIYGESGTLTGVSTADGYSIEIFATEVQPTNQQGPIALAFDSQGNLFIATGGYYYGGWGYYKIRKISAGTNIPEEFGAVKVEDPDGVAVDSQDNIIVSGGYHVHKFAQDGSLIWKIPCAIYNVQLVAVDENDYAYAGSLGTKIAKISPDGTSVTYFDAFKQPSEPAISPDGFLYVSQFEENNIVKVSSDTGEILEVIATGIKAVQPVFDALGDLYTIDYVAKSVLKISISEGAVTTIASGFTHPRGLAFDPDGNLFVSDSTDKIIYKIVFNNPPVAVSGGPYTDFEGSEITFDASGSTNPDSDPLQYRWDFNNDGTWDTSWSDDPTGLHTWYDDHSGTAKVEVSDGSHSSTSEASVTVNNADPVITSITTPLDPTQVNMVVELSSDFSDPGTLDTHTANIDWGDGINSPGIITEAGGSGTVTGSHSYDTPCVYQVTVTLTDDDGGFATIKSEYVVIFDPTGAFVSGGGLFDSPAGAFPAEPLLTGKAGFGFVSKYQKGATVPEGNTQFRFHAGNINFKSTSYDWLVVAGSKGMFKGTGTINGEGRYKFLISAIDGDLNGGNGADMFRIKIWTEDELGNENVNYDNNLEGEVDADPTTTLTHGSIKIHK